MGGKDRKLEDEVSYTQAAYTQACHRPAVLPAALCAAHCLFVSICSGFFPSWPSSDPPPGSADFFKGKVTARQADGTVSAQQRSEGKSAAGHRLLLVVLQASLNAPAIWGEQGNGRASRKVGMAPSTAQRSVQTSDMLSNASCANLKRCIAEKCLRIGSKTTSSRMQLASWLRVD